MTTDDLLLALNDRVGADVRVTVRFLTEERLAMLEGVLRSDFDVASDACPDHAKIATEPPMTDTDALAIYHVCDGAFCIRTAMR